MIDQDLIAFLTALDTGAGNRVHMGNAPQGTAFPFVVIRRTGGTTPTTLSGVRLFTRAQYAFHVLHRGKDEAGAGGYNDALPIALAITAALHGFSGVMGATTVQSARCLSEPVDASEVDGDKVIRWLQQDFLIIHR